MTWYEAAAYCNWLSEQEGLPEHEWCYEPNKEGAYAEGMKLARDSLLRTGYRLPTEAEWEYACRAGAVTSRCYGESVDLLRHYGWFMGNCRERVWPGASLKPNDWGLFDMHGNVWCWCHNAYGDYNSAGDGGVIEDNEDEINITDRMIHLLRGGAFASPSWMVRSGFRLGVRPTHREDDVGFRPARTFH
jgi:formylglycine-generating enzyme required for sulfatase activity